MRLTLSLIAFLLAWVLAGGVMWLAILLASSRCWGTPT